MIAMAQTLERHSISEAVEHVIEACEVLGEEMATIDGSAGQHHRAEVWSMGATLYELLAGTPPLPRGGHLPLRKLRPDVPPLLAAIVERSLMADPAARFSSVAELAGSLRGRVTVRPVTRASLTTTLQSVEAPVAVPSERPVALDARADGPSLRQTVVAALAGPMLLAILAATSAIVGGVSPAAGATESTRAPAVVLRLTAKAAESVAREKVVETKATTRPRVAGARRH